MLRLEVTLDLFELPPRARIRAEAVRWHETGMGPKAIAAQIAATSAERPCARTVQRALKLHASMMELGLTTPLVRVLEPPDDLPKLRRHRNAKFKFTPLDGYVPPQL